MLSYQLEELTYKLFQEFDSLTKEHYEEFKEIYDKPYNPDWESYLAYQKKNLLRFYTARIDGKLIGYNCYFIVNNLQSKEEVQAICHMVFISKHHRGLGIAFIKNCEDDLEKQRIDRIVYSVRPKFDYSPILRHLGHGLLETMYARTIKYE